MPGTYNPVVFTNAYVYLTTSSQNLSDHVKSVTLTRSFDDLNDDRMGLTAHSHLAGVEGWAGSIELIQEFASTGTNIDSILNGLVGGDAVQIELRPSNAARTSDNPGYIGNAVFLKYDPMTGAFGDLLKTTVPFMGAGNLTRSSSSS